MRNVLRLGCAFACIVAPLSASMTRMAAQSFRRVCLLASIVAAASCASDRDPAQEATQVDSVYGPGSPDPSGHMFGSSPRFEDYPAIDHFRGVPAKPDLASHADAFRFRTALLRDPNSGPNFAGRYRIVSRSCGRLCREFVIVDVVTGRVFPGLTDAPPFEYRVDSRLIAFEAPKPLPGRAPCAGCSAAYYVWENDHLELIPPETWIGSAPPPPAVRAFIDSVRAEEYSRVHAGPAVSRPTWDRLVIAARDGSRIVLNDQLAGDAIIQLHIFRGFIDGTDHYLIEVIRLQDGDFIIVDAATGAITKFDSPARIPWRQ